TRVWTLDADLAAAFDRLDHSHLLEAIGSFPGREMIRAWLKAGVFEPGKGFAPTGEGSPQGGVVSPLLLNVALHGLEEAAGVCYLADGTRTSPGSPVLIRYCDDFVVCCHTRRYFGQSNPSRHNMWVFGDAASGAYLPQLAWTPIIRHRKVTGRASPDDPALTSYWNQRRGTNQPPLDRSTLRLLKKQHGR